jgi:putative membrane protein
MSSDDAESPERARRLHPAGIAVLALGALREAALPLAALFAAGLVGGGLDAQALMRGVVFAAAGTLVAVLAGVLMWRTTSWQLDAGTLRHRRGLLSVRETDIPLARVQAVDTVRGPVQRLFGVVGVHVQTAGGGREGEIVLPALAAADVAALRDAVGARRGARAAAQDPTGTAVTAPAPPVAERRLDRRRLLVAALTAGQLGVLLPALAAAGQFADDVLNGDLEDAGRAGAGLAPSSPLEWALLVVALLLLAWLLSFLGAVVAFAGFTVTREGDRLRIRRGLLARREASVPVARIQAVRVVEGVLRRPWRLAALRIEVAGYRAEAAAAQTLFPLLRRGEVRSFLAELLPELADAPDDLTGLPRRAARRYALPPAAAGLALGGAAALLLSQPWPLVAALAGAAYGLLRYRAAGWRVRDGRLAIRSRRLACTTVLAPAARIQQHGLRQTILQRRRRLADLDVRVGAGTRGRVRHLDAATAARLFEALRLSLR